MLKKHSSNEQTPVFTINVKPAVGVNKTTQAPKLQHLKVTITDENVLDRSFDTSETSQKKSRAARIKLRDYLFQAETSARQKAAEKRKILQNLSNQRKKSQTQISRIAMKQQAEYIKKNKYGIKNSEMFEILKKQVQSQVKQNLEQIDSFKRQLNDKVRNCVIPSSEEMMMMYKLRTLLKQKMKGCIKEMRQAIQQEKTLRVDPVLIEIQLDQQQLSRDIGFTEQMFSKKYLEIEEKRKGK